PVPGVGGGGVHGGLDDVALVDLGDADGDEGLGVGRDQGEVLVDAGEEEEPGGDPAADQQEQQAESADDQPCLAALPLAAAPAARPVVGVIAEVQGRPRGDRLGGDGGLGGPGAPASGDRDLAA